LKRQNFIRLAPQVQGVLRREENTTELEKQVLNTDCYQALLKAGTKQNKTNTPYSQTPTDQEHAKTGPAYRKKQNRLQEKQTAHSLQRWRHNPGSQHQS
jgi:hypothetical protein